MNRPFVLVVVHVLVLDRMAWLRGRRRIGSRSQWRREANGVSALL